MKTHTLIFLILFFGFQGNSQDQAQIDSLLQVLKTDITETRRVDIYVKIADEYIISGHEEAKFYADSALKLAQDAGYLIGQVEALLSIGEAKQNLGQYNESLDFFNTALHLSKQGNYLSGKAKSYRDLCNSYASHGQAQYSLRSGYSMLEAYEELDDKEGIMYAHYSLGNILGDFGGDIQEGIRHLLIALEMSEEEGDREAVMAIYDTLGRIILTLDNYEEALEYFLKSLSIGEEIENTYRSEILKHIAHVYQQQGKYDVALEYFNKCFAFIEQHVEAEESYFADLIYNIGNLYALQGQQDKALEYLARSLEFDQIFEITRFGALMSIGEVYRSQNRLIESRTYFYEAFQVSKEMGSIDNISWVAQKLALAENEMGNHKAAYDYHVLHKQMSDSLASERNIKAIATLHAQKEFNQEKDSIQFENEKEKLVLNQKLQSQQQLQYATIAAITILLILFYILYRYYLSKQKANKLLQLQNEEITRQKAELESLDHAKSHFFANVSHELRTPLTLISGPLQNLIRKELSAESTSELEVMISNTNKLQHMVDDILNLSKLESDKIELKLQDVAITSFLMRIGGAFDTLAAHLDINYKVIVDIDVDEYLRIDVQKLETIINNLLSNAFKHTPSGGNVRLICDKKDQELRIEVKDTGTGIPEADLSHVFDRYFQGHQSDASYQGGTGIGLALAKEYTVLMEGNLTAHSESGRGTTFALNLVCEPGKVIVSGQQSGISPMPEPLEEHDFNVANDQRDFRILIVEDHLEMQDYLKKLLQKKYQVKGAINGKQALARLADETFDLVISDVMMPEMDGFALLKALRANEKYVNLPVIMLTALSDEGHKLQALSIGVDEYLAKPFSQNELLARISNMLIRYQQKRQAPEENETDANHKGVNEGITTKENLAAGVGFIEKVEEMILAELENEAFRLDDLAHAFHISERQFRRRIKHITGLSPKEFQKEVAMQRARRLLENHTYNNLTAVAYESGIRNTTRFAKYYFQRFGKDPREFFVMYA